MQKTRNIIRNVGATLVSPAGRVFRAAGEASLAPTLLLLLLAACAGPEAVEVEEKPDTWHPREAQSDFLDIGEQAGIEWLSFVPQDQKKYPEYFEGLDRDQKDRLRLAPKGSDEQVLIQFDLPEGSKLWPVDWYGTELMAIDLPNAQGISLAIAVHDGRPGLDYASRISEKRAAAVGGESAFVSADGENGFAVVPEPNDGTRLYEYYSTLLTGMTVEFVVVLEWERSPENQSTRTRILNQISKGISIKRELALEGSPKHKVSSSLDELLGGTLHFPEGTLNLPIKDGHLVRKTGGDSTIQIDGEGAEPWILIRRLDETDSEGDMRVRVRNDATFQRRLKVTSADFGKGRAPENAKLPIVAWSYGDSDAEQELLGIMKVGNEILEFEVVSTGLRDGDQRRAARKAAIELLATATAEPATEAPEFEPLIGWNVGTMGRDE